MEAPTKLTPAQDATAVDRPHLLFFYGRTSGPSRRVDGFLAQILQRHHNHSTFDVVRVPVEDYPELAERFKVTQTPTILVVQDRRLRARVDMPRGRAAIEQALMPWLR